MAGKISCLVIFVLLLMASSVGAQPAKSPQVGEVLPSVELPRPVSEAEIKYLGLSARGQTFKISEIKARAVIVEIFSMYCPYCQAEAPNVNKLYQLLESKPELKDKIKIIGIGVGNTQFEVATFKKKYTVAFPLLPDADFKLHKILGEPRTPYFIVVKLNDKKQQEVIYSKLGALENVDLFLAQIIRLSGLQ